MAGGFPGRTARPSYGPTYVNEVKKRKPDAEFGADELNLLLWQIAGATMMVCRAWAIVASGTPPTTSKQRMAWDSEALLGPIVWTRAGTGDYTWTFPSATGDDATGSSITLAFDACWAHALGTANQNMTGAVNANGYTGTMKAYTADSGAAADPSSFIVFWM